MGVGGEGIDLARRCSSRSLFGAQRFDWIDETRAPGWEVAGYKRHCGKHDKRADESGRIEGTDTVKQTAHGAAGCESPQ